MVGRLALRLGRHMGVSGNSGWRTGGEARYAQGFLRLLARVMMLERQREAQEEVAQSYQRCGQACGPIVL
jgi:hypothetical protein